MIIGKPETYRAIADGCRHKAARAASEVDKIEWLGLADSWLQLLKDGELLGEISQQKQGPDGPPRARVDFRPPH